MQKAEHIPAERMLVVANECDALLTEMERHHLEQCLECLTLFAKVVLADTEGNQ